MADVLTIALIGADGAGKTTIGRSLVEILPLPAVYLYMGVNVEASQRLLPTTRVARLVKRARGAPDGGGPPTAAVLERPTGGESSVWRSSAAGVRAVLRLTNRLAEEWYRQLVAMAHVRRGTIVVFDRHYFADYYAYDVAGGEKRSLTRRLHGYLLNHAYPKPDLTIFLDAAPEVLFARKGEGTIEALAQRRLDYLQAAPHCPNFVTVDAGRPLEDVRHDVVRVISDRLPA